MTSSIKYVQGKLEFNENNFKLLIEEVNALQLKIHSKTETVLNVSKELSHFQSEADKYRILSETFERNLCRSEGQIHNMQLEFTKHCESFQKERKKLIAEMDDLVKEKNYLVLENQNFKCEVRDLRKDCLFFRQKIAKIEVRDISDSVFKKKNNCDDKEIIGKIEEVEKLRNLNEQLKSDITTILADKEELITERDIYKQKTTRLTNEIVYLLNGDPKAVTDDVDQILSDNRFMKTQLESLQKETGMTKATLKKYRNLLGKRNKIKLPVERDIAEEEFDCEMEDFFPDSPTTSSNSYFQKPNTVISFRQVKEIVGSSADYITEDDYKTLTQLLVEFANDKQLALTHQRNTNKILGKKLSDIDLKVKSLENGRDKVNKSPNKMLLNDLVSSANKTFTSIGTQFDEDQDKTPTEKNIPV
uniref:Coiled-coil domain-containing protein n=1 Tax=Rhabditophanes sp. KR3021 TaxID=114890 RepID=A0AC35UCB3_9BILA